MKKLYGVTVAMITPFTEEGNVDVKALEKLTEMLISRGVNCLYPCGTTGDGASFRGRAKNGCRNSDSCSIRKS